MFKKNRWKPLYNLIKTNEAPVTRCFVRHEDEETRDVSRGSSTTTLSIQFAEGKYIIAECFYSTSFHRKYVHTHICERYMVYCRGHGADHDITKYIKAKKVYKILIDKFNEFEKRVTKMNDTVDERNAFSFIFDE